jgi:hypothetical protein
MNAALDLFSARESVTERIEIAQARVARHADEQLLVQRVTQYLVNAARAGDWTFLAEWASGVLTDAGIRASDQRTRRRILSTAICDGKRAGLWRSDGLVIGQARRGVTRWRLTAAR